MAIKSQRQVYQNGQHVGTLNYGADGNILNRDWIGADGKWGNFSGEGYTTPDGHVESGNEFSTADMKAYQAAKTAGDNSAALGIIGANVNSNKPNTMMQAQNRDESQVFDSNIYWERMGTDPNNLSDRDLAGFAVTMQANEKMQAAMARSNPDQVDAAGQMLTAYGKTPNFAFNAKQEQLAIPNPTATGAGGGGASAGKELAQINTNRAGRRSQGSSSYGGGRSSVRTSQQINTL